MPVTLIGMHHTWRCHSSWLRLKFVDQTSFVQGSDDAIHLINNLVMLVLLILGSVVITILTMTEENVLYLEGRFNQGFFASWVFFFDGGGAYIWRGLFLEFYGICSRSFLLEVGNNVHQWTIHWVLVFLTLIRWVCVCSLSFLTAKRTSQCQQAA